MSEITEFYHGGPRWGVKDGGTHGYFKTSIALTYLEALETAKGWGDRYCLVHNLDGTKELLDFQKDKKRE